MSASLKYLKGIDGLRALAVVSILIYHLDIYWIFPGGFLGVDIFFTVSGFLITYLLISEIQRHNKVSISGFYNRRAKRLFPALFFLLIASVLLSCYVLIDAKSKTLKDLLPAIFYYSNWWQIFSDQSYFEQIGRPPLLQHLWSLAIEEQFYLIWPILFLLVYRAGGRKFLAFLSISLAILSTLWMGWLSIKYDYPLAKDPSRIYLGTDTHAMGLLIGAFIAAIKDDFERKIIDIKYSAQLVPCLALVIIFLLIFLMQFRLEVLPELYRGGFFGVGLLTGALILLISANTVSSNTIFSNLFLSYIGARSYSLYLWHWPVYILVGAAIDNQLQIFIKIFLTLILAELSYQYVENPIRHNQYQKWSFLKISFYLAIVIFSLFLIGFRLGNSNIDQMDTAEKLADVAPKRKIVNTLDGLNEVARERWDKRKCESELDKARFLTAGSQITVFGDSVMLGAQNYLSKSIVGVDMDAAVGRQGYEGIARVREYKSKNKLSRIVLIHYGTNGFLVEKNFREILDELSDRDLVIVMNVYAQRKWQEENNILLGRLVEQYPNTRLLDWHQMVLNNPSILSADQVHPVQKGIELITLSIKNMSNLPGAQDVDSKGRIIPKACRK